MASPRLVEAASRTSTEAELRELARAKLAAGDAYNACLARNIHGLSEDERIDAEIERKRLYDVYWAACLAFQGAA